MATRPAPLRDFLARDDAGRVLGAYQLTEQLGAGGFAPVWLADERMGGAQLRKVAIKLFSTGGLDPRHAEMVVNEARALCRVEHPNVVRFYTQCADEEAGVLGLVMEYVRGTELRARLDAGPLSAGEVVALGMAMASALEAIHGAGLVHRDVKPANILVTGGVYKLVDFGVAAIDERPDESRRDEARRVVVDDLPLEVSATKASMLDASALWKGAAPVPAPLDHLSGTLGYIDPACVSTLSRANAASDIYSLGATLFECAAGMLPAAFAAGKGAGLKGDVLDGRAPAPSLAAAAPAAPPGLVRLVDRMIAPDPAKRPASATEVRAALEAMSTVRPADLPSVTLNAEELRMLRTRWTRGPVLLLVAGIFGMLASFVFMAQSRNDDVISGAAGFVAAAIFVGVGLVLGLWAPRS